MRACDTQFDLAVVGAGIVGTMVAYLAHRRKPNWNILLLDRSLVGHGATHYSVGLDLPWGRTALHRSLASYSSQVFDELKAETPDLPFSPIPLCGITKRDRVAELMQSFVDDSLRVARNDESELVRSCFSDLTLANEDVLMVGCTAHFGFPERIAWAIVEQLRQSSRVVCLEGSAIDSIVAGGRNEFQLEAADGRRFVTERVVIATGPWVVAGLGKEVAREAQVRIKKVAALHVDFAPRRNDPVLFFFDVDAFLLPLFEQRRWLFSFTSEEWDVVPDISKLSISTADRDAALAILERYCPSLVPHCQGGRVFCDGYGPNRSPVVVRHPDMPDYVLAMAGSGSGFRLAPGIAREALHLLGLEV